MIKKLLPKYIVIQNPTCLKKDYALASQFSIQNAHAAVNHPSQSPSNPYSVHLKCRDVAKIVRTDLANSRPFLPSASIHTHPLNGYETNARGNSGILRQVLDNRGTAQNNSMKLPNYNIVELPRTGES